MTFRRSLGHTREETGRGSFPDQRPEIEPMAAIAQPCLRVQEDGFLLLRTIKQGFCRGERGKVGEFSSWMNIYIFFRSILPFTSVLFWYSSLPLPHNFSNGPSLIGVVPSLYIEGVQTSRWRQTRAAKPYPRRVVASRSAAGYPDKNCNNQGTQSTIIEE